MKELLSSVSEWIYDHFLHIVCGYFLALIGYFAEIKSAVHVMWAAILIDLIFGILASIFRRKQKFCMIKFTLAVGRAIAVSILVALLYAMDKEMHQNVAASYYIAAYLISGFYAIGAAKNMDALFGGRIFLVLKSFFEKRVEETSGIDLKNTENGKL
jgi:hypothetical membrane protein